MKKLFTLVCAVMGLFANANAATVNDVSVCKHSYVLVCEDVTNNGTVRPGKGSLFGDGYFLDVTGGSMAQNKGVSNPAALLEDGTYRYGEEFAKKYADYAGDHLNCLRIKNAQDVIAMKVTAKSKVIILMQGNNTEGTSARIPKIATDEKLENALNAAPTADNPKVDAGYKYEWTADDDRTIYIGSYNGDAFIGMIIVEANEAPGTPTVKVGPQTYEDGLWFKEVTCKANDMVEEGSTESIPTVVTYTTDGTAPTAASTLYTQPIKCYANMTVRFQAFMDFGDGKADDALIADGADNEAAINFQFSAPTINAEGADVTIVHEIGDAINYYSLNGGEFAEGSFFTLDESATVTAYSEIVNGEYATFKTNSVSKDVYVLNPIKEKKTIQVTAGEVVVDEEATANATDGSTVYMVKDGAISADTKDFFVKNLEFAVVKEAKYQINGDERYIKMNNTNITFEVAEGDSVDVKVVCSLNACKNIDSETESDRQCYVNVSGTNYGGKDMATEENANVIEFGLIGGKTYTFQKYSGTGNIMIYSIEITPVGTDGISSAVAEKNVNAPVYNLAGQKVDAAYKGIIIKNGQKQVQK